MKWNNGEISDDMDIVQSTFENESMNIMHYYINNIL